MSGSPQRVVFVPASGPTGSGEFYRALNLARALRRIAPSLETHVLRSRQAHVAEDPDLHVHVLNDTPSRSVTEVRALLVQLRPTLAVFDGSGRTSQLREVQRNGGRVLWISNRPGRRRRALAWRRLRWIDLHVMLVPDAEGAKLTAWERLRAGLVPAASQRFASAIVPSGRSGQVELPDWLDARMPSRPAVFVSGGGGQSTGDGTPVPNLFFEAARRFQTATGHSTLVVLGPQYSGSLAASVRQATDPFVVGELPPEQLGAVLADASLVVSGAGNMLSNQVLLAGRPCVMVAAGGHDQPQRLADYVARGAVHSATLSASALADAAIALHRDPDEMKRLSARIARTGIRDDTERLAAWMARLIGDC